jgi:hypothetical protein
LVRSDECSKRDSGKFAAYMSWIKLMPQMLQLAIVVLRTWRRWRKLGPTLFFCSCAFTDFHAVKPVLQIQERALVRHVNSDPGWTDERAACPFGRASTCRR